MYRFGRRFMIPAPEAVNLLEVFSPKRLTWSGFYDRLILPLKRVYFFVFIFKRFLAQEGGKQFR